MSSNDIKRAKAALKQIIGEDQFIGYMGKQTGASTYVYAVPHHPGFDYVRILQNGKYSVAEAINIGAARRPDVLVEIKRKAGVLIVSGPYAPSAAAVLGEDVADSTVIGLGGGGGITHSYLGYNTVGGSAETVTSDGRTTRFKKISPASDCLLVSIGMHLTGSQTLPNPTNIGLQVLLMTDNSDDPEDVIALGPVVTTHVLGTNGRWIDLPITKLLTGGVDYWLAFRGTGSASNVMSIAYDTGGSDHTYNAGAAITVDLPPYGPTTTGSYEYSIRGGVIT